MYLSLLNGFEFGDAGRSIRLPLGTQRLLAFLALHQRPVRRPHVAMTLWADLPEERSHASLRSTLWRLRNRGCRVVETSADHLRLAPAISIDVREVEASAHIVLSERLGWQTPDVDRLCRLGELLPDWYDDWIVIERERLRQLRLHALEAAAEQLIEARRFAAAVEVALAAVAAEPLRETAHAVLIRAHLAEGNRAEALRQFRSCRELLRRELGVEPSGLVSGLINGWSAKESD